MSKFVVEYTHRISVINYLENKNKEIKWELLTDYKGYINNHKSEEEAIKAVTHNRLEGFIKDEIKFEGSSLYKRTNADTYFFRIRKIRTPDDDDWSVNLSKALLDYQTMISSDDRPKSVGNLASYPRKIY